MTEENKILTPKRLRKVPFSFSIERYKADQLKAKAKSEGTTVSKLVVDAVNDAFRFDDEANGPTTEHSEGR